VGHGTRDTACPSIDSTGTFGRSTRPSTARRERQVQSVEWLIAAPWIAATGSPSTRAPARGRPARTTSRRRASARGTRAGGGARRNDPRNRRRPRAARRSAVARRGTDRPSAPMGTVWPTFSRFSRSRCRPQDRW